MSWFTRARDRARDAFSPNRRAAVHAVSIAIVVGVYGVSGTEPAAAAAIVAAVVALFDLGTSVVFSTSNRLAAIYGAAAAVQAGAVALHLIDGQTWASAVAALAALIPQGIAASRTPFGGVDLIPGVLKTFDFESVAPAPWVQVGEQVVDRAVDDIRTTIQRATATQVTPGGKPPTGL